MSEEEKNARGEESTSRMADVDMEMMLSRALAGADREKETLDKANRTLIMALVGVSVVLVVLVVANFMLLKIKTPTGQNYFYIDPVTNKPVPMKAYDVPILTEAQMRQRLTDLINELGSLSWYNRKKILTSVRPMFYPKVYTQMLTDLNRDTYLNPGVMSARKIGTDTVVKDIRLLDVRKLSNGSRAEIWSAHVITTIRSHGDPIHVKNHYQAFEVVRGDAAKYPAGYLITKRIESPHALKLKDIKRK